MYVEQLTEKDLKKFTKGFECSVLESKKINNNELYLQLFTTGKGPQPEMWLSDFDLKISEYYKKAEYELKMRYVFFMYKKFGKKYKEDYIQNCNIQKEDRIL